jgi:peptidoglycan/xylan/chitin deacetylase (PgdA/CDA1 family)
MKKKLWILLLILLLLFVVKNHLHLIIGAETGEAKNELGKTLFQIETLFNHNLITRADTKEKIVALTIDDGPDPRFTPAVLDILKRYHVPATFFVVGQSCEKYPEIIKRELAEGNEIENHTYTHPDLRSDSVLQTEQEILKNQAVIERLTNKTPHYFRPPKRLFTNNTVDVAEDNGYETILWTVCVEHHASKTVEDMANRVIKYAKPGTIILTHDGRLDRTRSVEALPLIIKGYQKKGYRFVRLDELLKSNSI